MTETDTLQLIATTTSGLEACVKRELQDMGFADAKVYSPGRIIFSANPAAIVTANLHLRTADRVLLVIGMFAANDFDELFEGTRALAWDKWIPADGQFPVRGRSYKSQLTSVPAVQRTVKKAIVEQLMAAHKTETLGETSTAAYAIEVALRDNTALLTLDTTGAGLNKRGYRAAAGPAPLKETLAAAMIQLSFWKPDRPLIDPFCGSGTIAIEAAMIGRNIAPGLKRSFSAELWPAIDAELWTDAREKAEAAIIPNLPQRIIANDIEPKAISLASYHAELAGVTDDIHFQAKPFEDLTSNREYGCVICNPPYGRRLRETPDIAAVYNAMPEVFRMLKTWSFYVLTSMDLEKILSQKADRRRKLYNGQIECTYYQFHGPRPPKPGAPPVEEEDQPEPEAAFGGVTEKGSEQVDIFINRLKKMARHRRRWPNKGISCYRVYNRDIPEIPLAVDIYEDCLHIAEYDRPHERTAAGHVDWLEMLSAAAGEAMGIDAAKVYLKRRQRQRGTDQYDKAADQRNVYRVHEGELIFEVDLASYLDTGLFLDHRITRGMVRDESAGKRMLNLFAYTGAFSVYAAAGGAATTTTVDLSKTYLNWAKRNMVANGFTSDQHRFVQSDTMGYLADHAAGEHFDIAVIDPPTFSNSKRTEGVFDIQLDYADLINATARLMSKGGVIYFSTNFRKFRFDAAALGGMVAEEITDKTVPEDFANKRTHRCWRIVVQ